MQPQSSAAIANYILDRADRDRAPIDHMKLQKLVYLAHGWHLAVTGQPLIQDKIEAWQYGPVIPSLYHEFKECGSNPIKGRAREYDANYEFTEAKADLPAETAAVLEKVWNTYKELDAIDLSSLTHQAGTPWSAAAGKLSTKELRNKRVPIRDQQIRDYYVSLARRGKTSG